MKQIIVKVNHIFAHWIQLQTSGGSVAIHNKRWPKLPSLLLASRQFGSNNFDLLRILAATQVLFFHTLHVLEIDAPFWSFPFQYFPGVPVFFVISGYLVSASYERSESLKDYFRNRFLRIYPGLWICLVSTVIVALTLGFNFFHISALKWFLLQMVGVIYTPNFLAKFGFGSYNGSLWTIPIELQFYFLVPVIYILARTRTNLHNLAFLTLLAFFIMVAIAIGWYLPNMGLPSESLTEKLIRYSFIPHFYMFLAGVVLQRIGAYRSQLIFGKGFIWVAAYLSFCYLIPGSVESAVMSRLVLAVCTVSLSYTLPGVAEKLLRRNDISYGVYIYHGLILNIMFSMNLLHRLENVLLVLIGAYFAGCLSWAFVERRFLRKKKQKLRTL